VRSGIDPGRPTWPPFLFAGPDTRMPIVNAASKVAGVLPFEEARALVEQHAATLRAPTREVVELGYAAGRVLAEDLVADRDLPPFPRSTRDGFAVRAADVAQVPVRLRVVAEVRAGAASERVIAAGETAEIMTGAPVPAGAEAVVMVEHTARSGDIVEIQRSAAAGENVVPAGAEARQGKVVVPSGTRVGFAHIAVAAAVGKLSLRVFARPRIAILATGDELVPLDLAPGDAQIRNSNSYSLAAQVTAAGGDPVQVPIAPDEPERLRQLIAVGLSSDLLLLSGGVSAGKYDLVEPALREFAAEFFFTGAQIQPGRPVVFGRATARENTAYFLGLPGNPVSTMVTFELFARPLIAALAGMPPAKLVFVHARLTQDVKVKPGLRRFLPAVLAGEYERAEVTPVAWQGSGDLAASARANCYLVVPPDRAGFSAGDSVPVMLR